MSVVPRKAAACIIMRETPTTQILMGKRNASLRFMAGHHVFPGGRIEDDESTEFVDGAATEELAKAVHAVAREVFEETGLLCARGELPGLADGRAARVALLEESLAFEEILRQFGLRVHSDDFEPAGIWLTPEPSPVRFDTRYFLHRVRTSQEEHLIDGELVGLDWFEPTEARDRWHRGEIKISTPVAFALQQLSGKAYPEVLEFLSKGTERAPGKHSRFEVRRGITIIPLLSDTLPPATHTNTLVVGEKDLYVFDPGSKDGEELEHLAKQLDNMIALGGRVAAIVLTHSHRDHVGGVGFVRERYGCPVWAHEATGEQVDFSIDRHLDEGDVIESPGDPGWRLQVMHTPGHDPGHLCFFEESMQVLIGGDMVGNPGTIVVSRSFGGDMEKFMAMLQRMSEVDAKVLIPSHGQVMGNPREVFLENLAHRQWRENKIKDALESGASTIDNLLAVAYDDAPEEAMGLARHVLDAYLYKLGVVLET